jgi:hypothetical protein
LFCTLSRGFDYISNANPACSCDYFENFSFALFTPPSRRLSISSMSVKPRSSPSDLSNLLSSWGDWTRQRNWSPMRRTCSCRARPHRLGGCIPPPPAPKPILMPPPNQTLTPAPQMPLMAPLHSSFDPSCVRQNIHTQMSFGAQGREIARQRRLGRNLAPRYLREDELGLCGRQQIVEKYGSCWTRSRRLITVKVLFGLVYMMCWSCSKV